MPGEQCNFYIYYEVDDEEVPTALRLDEYEDEAEYGWVLLAATPEAAAAGAGAGAAGPVDDAMEVDEAA